MAGETIADLLGRKFTQPRDLEIMSLKVRIAELEAELAMVKAGADMLKKTVEMFVRPRVKGPKEV